MKLIRSMVVGACASMLAPAASADEPAIVFLSPSPLGVNQYLTLGAEGALQVAEDLGGSARIFESIDPITRQRDLDVAAEARPDVVIALSFQFSDALANTAPRFPEVSFIAMDFCLAERPDNVSCVLFREHEMSFLAGAEAGWLDPDGTFAAVGGVDIPLLRRYTDAFLDGVQFAAPDATTIAPQWIGGANPFSDPARAAQMATALYFDGTDTILVAAGASGSGVASAATQGSGRTVVGADANTCPATPGVVIDNVEKRVDRAVAYAVPRLLAGELQPIVSLGLAEGAVTLTSLEDTDQTSECLAVINAEVMANVNALRDQIIAGEVEINDPMAQ